jgi:hypothetical protein
VNFIIFVNIIVIIISFFLPNEFLKMDSYILYGIQFFTMIPYLIKKLMYVKNAFLPTFFALFYYLINQFLGSILIPRDYGWNKEFTSDLLSINNYNIIISYFLLANLVLFIISYLAIKKLNTTFSNFPIKLKELRISFKLELIWFIIFIGVFTAISYFEVFMFFSFQLAIFIILFSYIAYHKKWYRFIIYLLSLYIMVLYSFESKREVVVVLFLILFVETYHSRSLIQFTIKKLITYILGFVVFIGLILISSILRGYGDYGAISLPNAITYVPQYINSDIFIDGITDNLELNYSYGVAVTSMDMIVKGELNHQYGLTIIKLLFLPIPRDIFPNKPESIMQLYTKKRDPTYWEMGGSLPVIFPSEMYLNFNYLGLFFYALIWTLINNTFIYFHSLNKRGLLYFSFIFGFIIVLFFARGSGFEQYVLYYLFSIPIILFHLSLKYLVSNNKPRN